jgi:hypothetical protein
MYPGYPDRCRGTPLSLWRNLRKFGGICLVQTHASLSSASIWIPNPVFFTTLWLATFSVLIVAHNRSVASDVSWVSRSQKRWGDALLLAMHFSQETGSPPFLKGDLEKTLKSFNSNPVFFTTLWLATFSVLIVAHNRSVASDVSWVKGRTQKRWGDALLLAMHFSQETGSPPFLKGDLVLIMTRNISVLPFLLILIFSPYPSNSSTSSPSPPLKSHN